MKTLVGSYLDNVQLVPFFTSSDFSHVYEDTNILVGSYLDSVQIVPFLTSSGFSHIYEDTNTLVGSYLDSVQIVPYNHKKHHTLPADVLPSASEDLFQFVTKNRQFLTCEIFYIGEWTDGWMDGRTCDG